MNKFQIIQSKVVAIHKRRVIHNFMLAKMYGPGNRASKRAAGKNSAFSFVFAEQEIVAISGVLKAPKNYI